jgi:arylsulfatase A-like enzyme
MEWYRRHMIVGALLGLVLGCAGQLAVQLLAPGEVDASAAQRVASIVYSASAWVVLSFVLALAGHALLQRARWASLGLSALVLGIVGFISVGGIALRVVSGSFLTLGAVMFSLGSMDHFVKSALVGYTGWSIMLFVVGIGSCAAVAWALRPAATRSKPRRKDVALVSLLAMLVTVVYVRRADHQFVKGMFVSGPLLALVSSLDTSFELDRVAKRQDELGQPMAPDGPPRSDEGLWRKRIANGRRHEPNVLLVTLESIALDHMSLYGYERATTPTLEKLAREGLHMTRAWTTATHSNYAQMAILSSLFPRRRQTLDMYRRLDYPRALFHDVFSLLGYDTATISSQDENWQGMRRFQNTGTETYFWSAEHYEGEKVDSGVEQYVPDDATTDVVLDWLSQARGRPWALYLNYQGTHFPYTISRDARRPWVPDEPNWSTFVYLGYPESDKANVVNRYDNALRFVDEQLGRVIDYLVHSGEKDDTLIVISADHGEMFFERGLVTHGKTLNEIEARVPIILHWPGHIDAEERDEPVSHIDMLPTLFDVLGLPPHPSWQGRSFKDPSNAQQPLSPSVGALPPPIYMNIQGLRYADSLVCWPWKLILERTSKKPYLYNLASDPDELDNRIEAEPEIATLLEDTLSKQLLAQLDYHAKDASELREQRYQPRLRPCPALPSQR